MPRKYQVPVAARKGLAQFVRKLVELIENSPQDTIKWTRDGTAFLVIDPKQFSKRDLGQWFRSSLFNSFVRQLNFYNFTKVSNSKYNWEFTHPHLRRGDWASLSLIKRKTSNEFHAVYDKEVKALRKSVGDLQGTVGDLRRQLSEALALVSSMEAQRDAAVSRSILIYEQARAAGVHLDAKFARPPPVRSLPAPPTLRARPRKRQRAQRAPIASPPSSSPRIAPAPQHPVSPTIVTPMAPSSRTQHDMFLLPGDPSDLHTSTLLDDDDDDAMVPLVDNAPPAFDAPDGGHVLPFGASLDVGNDVWLDFAASLSSKPPTLTRGLSGVSIGSLDAYNAFNTTPAQDADLCLDPAQLAPTTA